LWISFFQAEDGIRDDLVTGVQTCALPICEDGRFVPEGQLGRIASLHEAREHLLHQRCTRPEFFLEAVLNETGHRVIKAVRQRQRSEERRVGKECRYRWGVDA